MKSSILVLLIFLAASICQADPAPGPSANPPPDPAAVSSDCPNLKLRGSLDNSRLIFEQTGLGRVAFLGGSITEREGYRPLVCAALQKKFPNAKFTFINAGIGSTASITGAFRFENDVLSRGPVDLLFVEFAVNDDQDGHYTRAECIRGLEGILRHLWLTNPHADVVVTYFVNENMVASFNQLKTDPLSSSSHELVLEHYGVSGVELNREVSARIADHRLTWKQYGGTHPGPIGNQLGANMITQLLNRAWSAPLTVDAMIKPHLLPKALDSNSYFNGHFVDLNQAQIINGWSVGIPDWKKIGGGFRPMFAGRKFICATTPGATLKLPFNGRAVGIYLLAGFDAGILEASVDGAPPRRFDLFTSYSRGLHYPRSIVFDGDLHPGHHLLVLRLTGDKNPGSKGTSARIMEFCVNGED